MCFMQGRRGRMAIPLLPAGRVLAVSALGKTQDEARQRAYDAVSQIHFENCHYRRDIAVRKERDKLTSR